MYSDEISCDKEPIHIIGHIQPHGFLLAIDETNFIIKQISNNVEVFLGKTAEVLLGQSLSLVINQEQLDYFKEQLNSHRSLKELNPLTLQLAADLPEQLMDIMLHRTGGLLVLEFEPAIIRSQYYAEHILSRLTAFIRSAREIDNYEELFNATVKKVKKITGFDRVMLYQFDKDGHGKVSAEAKEAYLPSYKGLHYPASDIPQQARKLYVKNCLRLIVNVHADSVSIVPTNNPIISAPLDLSFSVLRSVSPVHIQYLKNMGVQASLSISITVNDELWGLIACHHQSPKFLPYELRIICEHIGQIISWQVAAIRLKIIGASFAQNCIYLEALSRAISEQEDWVDELCRQEDNLLKMVDASGVGICYGGQYTLIGQTPSLEMVRKIASHSIASAQNRLYVTSALSREYPEAAKCKALASGLISIVFSPADGDVIMWFRPEQLQTINWAGNPYKAVLRSNEDNALTPRRSFELWQEAVNGQSLDWSEHEIETITIFKRFLLEAKLKFYHKLAQEEMNRRVSFAEEMRKRQEDYIDRICHEIRNPINGILGSLDSLNAQLENIEELYITSPIKPEQKAAFKSSMESIRSDIANISECAEHQAVITNDVLNLSRLENAKLVLVNEPFNLSNTIRKSIRMFDAKIKTKGIEIKTVMPLEDIYVKGDSVRAGEIFINLISNAVKFTQKGSITIRLSEQIQTETKQTFLFSVSDTGIGISAEDKAKLFNRFAQANKRISYTYGGSGLGLSIVYELVKLMGGNITVESEVDKGTTFNFTACFTRATLEERQKLICSENAATQCTKAKTSFFNVTPLKDKRILIVEDNPINQKVLSGLLTRHGYNCDVANNGKLGVEQFMMTKYDAVFMDVEMPVMDGFAAAQHIRINEKDLDLSRTPIICISGNAREEYKQKALLADMDDYIVKPFNRDAILNTLEQAFAKPAAVMKSAEKTLPR